MLLVRGHGYVGEKQRLFHHFSYFGIVRTPILFPLVTILEGHFKKKTFQYIKFFSADHEAFIYLMITKTSKSC